MASPFIRVALSFVVSLVGASCGSGQATSWNPPPTYLKTPNLPWFYHSIYTAKNRETFAELRNKFKVTGYELLSWNCFLDRKDGVFEPGTQVCQKQD